MSLNENVVRIIEPSKEIFELIGFYTEMIQKALPDSKITLIGSFAIPMCGKEEFDLLVEVDDVEKSQERIQERSQGRMGIGPIVDGEGFCRSKKRFGIICELHIVPIGHHRIRQYTDMIDRLRSNPQIIEEYEELKRSLDGHLESEYKKEKSIFLKRQNMI